VHISAHAHSTINRFPFSMPHYPQSLSSYGTACREGSRTDSALTSGFEPAVRLMLHVGWHPPNIGPHALLLDQVVIHNSRSEPMRAMIRFLDSCLCVNLRASDDQIVGIRYVQDNEMGQSVDREKIPRIRGRRQAKGERRLPRLSWELDLRPGDSGSTLRDGLLHVNGFA